MARNPLSRVARTLGRYAGEYRTITPQGVRMIGEEIMTDVKASRPGHGVPRDLGDLSRSGRAVGPRADGSTLLGFGGPGTLYALLQHERLDYHHRLGEARYLTRGVGRWRPGGSAAIAALKRQAVLAARRARSA